MKFDAAGKLQVRIPPRSAPALRAVTARLRQPARHDRATAATTVLRVTTDNGGGNDAVAGAVAPQPAIIGGRGRRRPSLDHGRQRPAEPGAAGETREPETTRDRQQRQPLGVRGPPAAGGHEQHQPDEHQHGQRPTRARPAREAAYRKNAPAIPAMPTNGQGDAFGAGAARAGQSLARLVVPVRVVVPLLVALLGLLQRALGLLVGGVRAEPVDGRADVLARSTRWCFTQYQYLPESESLMPPKLTRRALD